ncbi:purine-cytosine permease family protein [Zophobihabitans entericus]|uniref:Cytosine permease n=1 Tax=Zophobihabitans entericus TaxID=1635327 RepID=A0A6G9I8M7_9GAMM|nr:cytosine permease [Zophobihabitans entericus]QIQ20566.1 cytosine permease [Zophobihabitans entericus]
MTHKKYQLNNIIEQHAIDYIPENERHGKLLSQFTLWFGANLQITAIITGALAVVFGGDIFWSIIGLFIGQLLGGSIMALHGAQGPKLGLPQMVMSRASFGIYGAMLPIILVCIMYIGFSASGSVLAGQAVARLLSVSDSAGILLFGACLIGFTFCGYKTIHRIGKVASLVGIVAFFYMFYILITQHNIIELLSIRHFSWINFSLAIALSTSWQIAFGPYAADYSRYLPTNTPMVKTFFAIGSGSVIGTQIAMVFGVLVAGLAAQTGGQFRYNEVSYIVELSGVGFVALLLYFSIAFGKVVITTLNAYGSFMSMTTIISGLRKNHTLSQRSRLIYILVMVGLSIMIALLGRGDFLRNFSTFLLFLLTFFTPWSAINLVDYYLVKKKHYDIPSLFDTNGLYGKWNKVGMGVYIFGILIQLLFIHTPFYTGVLVSYLHNTDISWMIGWIIPAVLYYFLSINETNK